MTMSLPITNEVSAHVGRDLRGVLLGLVEVYQRRERWEDVIACLERLQRHEPDDVVVKLFLAELLLQARPGDKNVCRKVVRLAEGIGTRRRSTPRCSCTRPGPCAGSGSWTRRGRP